MKTCQECGGKFHAHFNGVPLCGRHYKQMNQYGKIFKRTIHDPNSFVIHDDCVEIFLYNIRHEVIDSTFIDKHDAPLVLRHKWSRIVKKNKYAATILRKEGKVIRHVYLHQFLLGEEPEREIDHHDGNGLNNRRSNLRFATRQQNSRNTKKLGYSFIKRINRWHARICIDNKEINLGYYKTEEEALEARKRAEKKYFGEFSRKNQHDT